MSAVAEEPKVEESRDVRRVEVISRDKRYLSGWPRFPGTRVPVRALVDVLIEGRTIDQFVEEDYPGVTRKQAEDFLRYLCQQEKLYLAGHRHWGLDEGQGSDYLEDDPEKW